MGFAVDCARGLAFGILLVGLLCVSAGAQTVTVEFQDGLNAYAGTSDTSIYSDNTGNSNGGGQSIIVGRTGPTAGGALRRGLISFNLASLPTDVQIIDVTLELNVTFDQTTGTAISLHRLSNSWGEGTTDPGGPSVDTEGTGAPAAAGDATWANRFHPDTPWTAAGGDFEAAVSGSVTTAGMGIIEVRGAGMVADVQAWVNGSLTNYGWALLGNEEMLQTAVRIASSENSGSKPKLIVQYQPVVEITRSQWPE